MSVMVLPGDGPQSCGRISGLGSGLNAGVALLPDCCAGEMPVRLGVHRTDSEESDSESGRIAVRLLRHHDSGARGMFEFAMQHMAAVQSTDR